METTEEKAKAYDEALEKAKELYNRGYTSITGEIFPELAESNDEKVRKALIDFFGKGAKYGGQTNGVYDKDILAWLEKQGETSPVLSNSSNIGKDEQKPIEENKGNIGGISSDEAVLDALIRRLEGEDIYVSPHLAVECLESLKGRVLPKQEWSEEDEQHVDSLLKRLDALCRNKFERTRFAISEDRDWLKSLKDRVGCEANCTTTKEWSEDDKRKIYRIYSILRQAADTHAFSTSCRLIGDKECMELQDWLKSLRPQNRWKPSDEQMNNK